MSVRRVLPLLLLAWGLAGATNPGCTVNGSQVVYIQGALARPDLSGLPMVLYRTSTNRKLIQTQVQAGDCIAIPAVVGVDGSDICTKYAAYQGEHCSCFPVVVKTATDGIRCARMLGG